MPKFENNIPGMISQIEGTMLTHLASTCPPHTTIVNIGCWEGRSLRYMLDGHPPPNCSIYGIDLYIDHDILHKNVLAHDTHNQITLLQGNSTDPQILDQIPSNISLLFIDGDHSYSGCLADLNNFWHKTLPLTPILVHDHYPVNNQLFHR